MVGIDVWSAINKTGEALLLDRARPDSGLVEEALSFDATALHQIASEKLRQYLVGLGQYLITLQFTENQLESIYNAWNRALDMYIYKAFRNGVMLNGDKVIPEGKTISERRFWVISEDKQASDIYNELLQADAKKTIVKDMARPVEQYINTLKKELEARSYESRIPRENG